MLWDGLHCDGADELNPIERGSLVEMVVGPLIVLVTIVPLLSAGVVIFSSISMMFGG
jgi:hypothetical protein